MKTAAPNLDDYDRVRATFSWEGARAELDGLPGGLGLNIAHEAVDRHAAGPRGDHVAIRWLAKGGQARDYTHRELRELTNRFANVLDELGVQGGERVFALAGRLPELYVAALGTLKQGAVFCPMFSAFGPEPIRARMAIGRARVLVTTEALYRRKVAALRERLPDLAHVLLIGEDGGCTAVPGTLDFRARLRAAADRFVIPPTAPEAMALLHFTRGTTGTRKGAVHVHEAVVAHHITGRYALDLHPDDVRPGSMGKPLPSVEAAIVRRIGDDRIEVVTQPDVQGELALRPGWPSMFRDYLGEPDRYRKCFVGGWYLSGDLARRDADGYFWFVGRADDVIKTSGHLIGPFEVESVIMEHPAVAEAGVIGKPDPVAMEVVKAFVSLKAGVTDTPELRRALLAHARARLGAVVALKEIAVTPSLPKTRSGKIMRRLLKARELGLPEGDVSTLEEGSA